MSSYLDNVVPGPGLDARMELEGRIAAAAIDPNTTSTNKVVLDRVMPTTFLTPNYRDMFTAARELDHEGQEVSPEAVHRLLTAKGNLRVELTDLVEVQTLAPSVARVGLLVDNLLASDRDRNMALKLNELRTLHERRANTLAAGGDVDELDARIERLHLDLQNTPRVADWSQLLEPWSAISTEPVAWLVDRFIYSGTVQALVGRPGVGKTFAAVALACSVASGRDFLGHLIRRPGPVVYIAAEGRNAIGERVTAWRTHYDVSPDELDNLLVLNTDAQPISLSNPAHLAGLTEGLRSKNVAPQLIVVDTWNMAAGLTDENNNAEVGTVAAALSRLAGNTGAAVLIVAHPPKGGSAGNLRGASALEGAVRTVLAMDDKHQLRHTKNNLGAEHQGVAVKVGSVPGVRLAEGQPPEDVGVLVLDEDNPKGQASDSDLLDIVMELGGQHVPVAMSVVLEEAKDRLGVARATVYRMRYRLLDQGRLAADGNNRVRIPNND